MDKKTQEIIRKLNRCKISAIPDNDGNIRLPDVKLPSNGLGEQPIVLPVDEMETFLEEACLVSASMLDDKVFANVLRAVFFILQQDKIRTDAPHEDKETTI